MEQVWARETCEPVPFHNHFGCHIAQLPFGFPIVDWQSGFIEVWCGCRFEVLGSSYIFVKLARCLSKIVHVEDDGVTKEFMRPTQHTTDRARLFEIQMCRERAFQKIS